MDAGRGNVVVAALVVMGVLMLHRVEGMNHTVGGSVGWKVPSNGASTYSDWASTITFEVGDVLLFEFGSGTHDVAVVTKEDYDGCNTATPVDQYSTGPTAYSLDVPGDYYFICTLGANASHCRSGQKLAITVADTSSSGPTASPPKATGSAVPPPPNGNNGSPSLAASLSLIFVTVVLSFVCL